MYCLSTTGLAFGLKFPKSRRNYFSLSYETFVLLSKWLINVKSEFLLHPLNLKIKSFIKINGFVLEQIRLIETIVWSKLTSEFPWLKGNS